MIRKLIVVGLLLILGGCSMSESQTTEIDNDKIAVDPINKLQSAANVKVDNEYDFAYSNQVIADFPTFANTNTLTIVSNSDVEFSLYGSKELITDLA